MNLSFAGCGFNGVYHIGVASCIKEHAPYLCRGKVAGASAGAMIACCLVTDCCLGTCTTNALELVLEARSRSLGPFHPGFDLGDLLNKTLEKNLPDNAHEICSGKLHISVTRLPDRKNVIISEFKNKQELVQALLCSCFIPFFSGYFPPEFRGVRYIDGALSDNLPILDKHTITVSPFSGESDICPRDVSTSMLHMTVANTSVMMTAENLVRMMRIVLPPHLKELHEICQRGFSDALRFLKKNNLIQCPRHLSSTALFLKTNYGQQTPAFPSSKIVPISDEEVDALGKASFYIAEDDAEWNSEEEEEGQGGPFVIDVESEKCMDCHDMMQIALVKSLPQPVVAALGIDSVTVTRGWKRYLRQLPAKSILSLSTLPFEATYRTVKRFVKWIPYLNNDLGWVLQHLLLLLRHVAAKSGRYLLRARLTCEVAIDSNGRKPSYNTISADILESVVVIEDNRRDPATSAPDPGSTFRSARLGGHKYSVEFSMDILNTDGAAAFRQNLEQVIMSFNEELCLESFQVTYDSNERAVQIYTHQESVRSNHYSGSVMTQLPQLSV